MALRRPSDRIVGGVTGQQPPAYVDPNQPQYPQPGQTATATPSSIPDSPPILSNPASQAIQASRRIRCNQDNPALPGSQVIRRNREHRRRLDSLSSIRIRGSRFPANRSSILASFIRVRRSRFPANRSISWLIHPNPPAGSRPTAAILDSRSAIRIRGSRGLSDTSGRCSAVPAGAAVAVSGRSAGLSRPVPRGWRRIRAATHRYRTRPAKPAIRRWA